jgi:hypothetical protein
VYVVILIPLPKSPQKTFVFFNNHYETHAHITRIKHAKMNNFYDLTHPSNTVFYYVRLISHFNPFFSSINQCKVGYVGDGLYCGKDSDLDGIPDYALSCTGPHCTKVCIWYRPSQLTVYEECHPLLIKSNFYYSG